MKPSNQLFEHIFDFCQEQNLLSRGSTIIVGLSGGPDSVFLLHYLASVRQEMNLTLIAAHLDHGWRAESGKDAAFCQQLADTYQISFVLRHLKDTIVSLKINEELGRKARRAFFEQLVKEHNAQAIALAHHADDQMETFIMRFIRGASLTGLAGIKPKDGLYIRPLLEISKQEILDYLHEHKIPYVIDASNESDEYLRNRIRNSVIPALKVCDNRFEKNFAATHAKLVETEEFLQELTKKSYNEIINPARAEPVEAFEQRKSSLPSIQPSLLHRSYGGQAGRLLLSLAEGSGRTDYLDIQKLLALHPVIRNRVLINWLILHKVPFTPSQGLLNEIVRFLENSKNNKHVLYQKWYIIKKENKILLKLVP